MQPMKRNCVGLPWSLEHRLSGYALAASAAGVGVVALAQAYRGENCLHASSRRVF